MASSSSSSVTSRHSAAVDVPDFDVAGMAGASYGRRGNDACEADDDGTHSVCPHTTAASTLTATAVGVASSTLSWSTVPLSASHPVPVWSPVFQLVPDPQPVPVCSPVPQSVPVRAEFFTQPAAKKLRLPPPSPSLLSLSSGSPPMSPLRPVCRPPRFRPPAAAAAVPAARQHAARLLSHDGSPASQYITVTGTPPFVVSSGPRGAELTTASTTTAPPSAAAASQSSQVSSVTKSAGAHKCRFSLRQLIEDDIIQPGPNVLSVRNPVIFSHH